MLRQVAEDVASLVALSLFIGTLLMWAGILS